MGLDPDPFDDIFADNTAKNNTRAGGKFQPKARRGPTRKESAVPSSPSSPPVETSDSAKNKFNVALYNERCLEPGKPLENVAKTESVDHTVENSLQMGLHSDHFDDIFADNMVKNNTKAGGKFQPKAKSGPARKESTIHSFPSSQPVETGDSAKNESSVASQTENPSEPCLALTDGERCLESVNPVEHGANEESVDQSVSAPPDSDVLVTEWRSCFEKSAGENADIFLGLESLEDFVPHSTTVIDSSTRTETPAIPDNQNAKDRLASPVISHATDSGCISNIADNPTCPELSPAQDPLTCGQPIVSIDEGGCNMHDGRLESEQLESYPCLESREISGLTTTSGRRTGKFQPKPKIQIHKEITEASTAKPDAGESIVSQMNEHMGPSEIEDMDKGSLSAFRQDDVLDFSSLGLDHSILTEPTSELPADEQLRNLTEASQAETVTREEHVEAASEMREKIATRRAKAGKSKNLSVSDRHLNQQDVLTSSRDNVAGRMLRPRRKRTDEHQLVDESEDEEPDEEFSADCPDRSVMDEANDEDFQEDNGTQAKKQQRKSKKPAGEKEKPVRKRKKAGEAPEQATAVAPKKFSHSTRQKRRRRVDKVLLETPEDEIDFQKVPLRDLIVLADYKERIAKKEAANLEAHLNSQSAGTTKQCSEDEGFASEQGEEADDGQESPKVQEASSYFNYQTYMDKTPSTRWSKQDTELFYEAVQQFGTDLSMIQQLFPGRTRRQIKLKYKKEERQHPLRLREALTNRGNDHSHFEQVIERLRQIAAENNQNSSKDETISLPDDEEAEQIPETNEEASKSEQQTEQAGVEGLEPEISVQSPLKDYDSESDLFDWSEYKSEV